MISIRNLLKKATDSRRISMNILLRVSSLYQLVKVPHSKKDVRDNYGSGSAIPIIVLKDFKRMPISFPSLKEQKKITNICVLLDEKIQLVLCQDLKQIKMRIFNRKINICSLSCIYTII